MDVLEQAESPPSAVYKKNNKKLKNIPSPALTPEDSHSAKVLRPWEGSPGFGSGEE